MSVPNRELVFLIRQFLDEEGLTKTMQMLDRETGYVFDLEYLKDLLMSGTWDEAENYLGGFTKVEDNKYSRKVYFEIRKQRLLEALDEQNFVKALDILKKDMKVFQPGHKQLFRDIGELFTLDNIRDHEMLSSYMDASSARKLMTDEVIKVLKANPILKDKLHFPEVCSQRLKHLANQGLNWQHLLCKNPLPNPQMKALLEDHVCGESRRFQSSENDPPSSEVLLMSLQSHASSSITSSTIGRQGALSPERPISTGAVLDGQKIANVADTMPSESLDKVKSSDGSPFPVLSDLPKHIVRTLTERSSPVSMDFHPVEQTTLLVGTSIGEIGSWDIISSKKLFSINFKVWDIAACSMCSQAALVGNNPSVMVSRVMWSPDGSLFAVAFSKHLVQLYSYYGGGDIRRQLEIDAHVGGVNDIAFSKPNLLFLITCGDDKLVKVWDVLSGTIAYTLEGHDAPVYSVCCHVKSNIHFIFSISMDGKLKAWLYDNNGSMVNSDVNPCLMRLAYSANGERLFSSGTDEDGLPIIFEWNQSEGTVKRTYRGLEYRSPDALHFDTTKNQFLAAGDEYVIKIWDMNHVELLTTIEADGCLKGRPVIRFNKEGTLLAATAVGNNIKILASDSGFRMVENSDSSSDVLPETGHLTKNTMNMRNPNSISSKQDCGRTQKLSEISGFIQCVSQWLPSITKNHKISKLAYTSTGTSITALTLSGVHLCWRWPKSSNCVAPISVQPELIQPRNGGFMTNEIGTNMDKALPCFALSKNDSYAISASWGQLSLFNMISLQRVLILETPSDATCVAFHPLDNNTVAIGTMDSIILVYHVHRGQVMEPLRFHEKKITSLAFSSVLNVLVSLGADAKIAIWKMDGWELQETVSLTIPSGAQPGEMSSETEVQFHQDQRHLLVIHESFLAMYDIAMDQRCVNQWANGELYAPITHATFSCDSQLIYASFLNGSVYIFTASDLQPKCCIKPSAFLPANTRNDVYPAVIAAHPKQPYRLALGLSNGEVCIIEPPETTEKWPISMN